MTLELNGLYLPYANGFMIVPIAYLVIDLFFSLGHVALVDTLVAKTRAWEEDRGISFAYDGVPLLAMLDEYATLRLDREEEKRRMRVNILVGLIIRNFFLL